MRLDFTPRVEPLEDRLALSATWQNINLSVPGDAYTLAGTTEQTDYTAQTKWPQPGGAGSPVTITYSYSNLLDGTIGLPAATVKAVIQEALSEWASVAPLRFVEVPDSGPAPSKTDYPAAGNPMIRFGHLTIDGPYGVLGYAYYPGSDGLAGDVTFDDSEHWTTDPSAGLDLLEVATHEIGHALGLAHEPEPSDGGVQAIMNPYYAGVYHGLGTGFLFADDVAGVRALYGAGTGSVTPLGSTKGNPTPASPGPQKGFTLQGNVLHVTGTAADDAVTFDTSTGALTLNGVAYAGDLSAVRYVVVDGGGGNNSVTVTGASGDAFYLSPGKLGMADARWCFTATNCQTAVAQGGGTATVSGDGKLVASPSQAQLTGTGWSLTARGVGSVTVTASGAADSASLLGGASPSLFVSTPSSARLWGAGYSIAANGFHSVSAYAGSRADAATLTGSAGDDSVTATTGYSQIQGPNGSFTTLAAGFGSVTVNGNGGSDSASLQASPGDVFGATGGSARLTAANGGAQTALANFASVQVSGGAGNTAYLTSTGGSATFVVMAGSTSMRGTGYAVTVTGFGHVNLTGQPTDRVLLYDAPGNNTLSASGSSATMAYQNATVRMTGVSRVNAIAMFGGTNARRIGATSLAFSWWGNWE